MKRLLVAAVALISPFFPATGWAHSTLARSEPISGAVVKAAPNELRIWFTEPIKVGLSTIEVRDQSGQQVDDKDLRADEREKSLVHLTLRPNLNPGTYKVSWTAVAQDMHATKGTFKFRVAPKRE
jgi:methionine-rich copper-binding protein CopC